MIKAGDRETYRLARLEGQDTQSRAQVVPFAGLELTHHLARHAFIDTCTESRFLVVPFAVLEQECANRGVG